MAIILQSWKTMISAMLQQEHSICTLVTIAVMVERISSQTRLSVTRIKRFVAPVWILLFFFCVSRGFYRGLPKWVITCITWSRAIFFISSRRPLEDGRSYNQKKDNVDTVFAFPQVDLVTCRTITGKTISIIQRPHQTLALTNLDERQRDCIETFEAASKEIVARVNLLCQDLFHYFFHLLLMSNRSNSL